MLLILMCFGWTSQCHSYQLPTKGEPTLDITFPHYIMRFLILMISHDTMTYLAAGHVQVTFESLAGMLWDALGVVLFFPRIPSLRTASLDRAGGDCFSSLINRLVRNKGRQITETVWFSFMEPIHLNKPLGCLRRRSNSPCSNQDVFDSKGDQAEISNHQVAAYSRVRPFVNSFQTFVHACQGHAWNTCGGLKEQQQKV